MIYGTYQISDGAVRPDEPTGEVDTKTRDMIVELLRGLSDNGQTILIVTHDIAVSAKTRRIISMRYGMIESDKMINKGHFTIR